MTIKFRTKEAALAAVCIDGHQLGNVLPSLCDDVEVVSAAIQSGGSIFLASFRLQNSPEISLLYAYNTRYPDYNYARALYCVQLNCAIFKTEYCSAFSKSREFNVDAKLCCKDFTSPYSKYNTMTPLQLEQEALSIKYKEILSFKEAFYKYIDHSLKRIDNMQSSPLKSPLLSLRGVNRPFADILGLLEKEIRKYELEKDVFCSTTSGGSYPEKFVTSFLKLLGVSFTREMIFPWSEGNGGRRGEKRYDFYLPAIHTIIEVHGAQHYQDGFTFCGGRTLLEEKANDIYKKTLAKENGIREYIVINALDSNPEYLTRSIKENKEITSLFNIMDVDWDAVRCGAVFNAQDIETPAHNLKIHRLQLWIAAIKDVLVESDFCCPPGFRKNEDLKPYTPELEAHVQKAIPSKAGLYPHEIVLLNDVARLYSTTQTDFPGKWYYCYGITDVSYYITKLLDGGFLQQGGSQRTLEMQNVSALKYFITQNGLKATGTKPQLISRILNEVSNQIIATEFTTKYYELTESGKKEIEENQYLFGVYRENDTIWSLNRRHAKSSGAVKRQVNSRCPGKKYHRIDWTDAARIAKIAGDYLTEIRLYTDVMYNDLSGFDDDTDDFHIKFVQDNLHFYFPYKSSLSRCAPGLIREIQKAIKASKITNTALSVMITDIIFEREVMWHLFTKEEAISIIECEIRNDIVGTSIVYEQAYKRIQQNGIHPFNKPAPPMSQIPNS